MKFGRLFLSIISLFIVSGCVFALSTVQPETAVPEMTHTLNSMPRLDPSPTALSSTLPLTCQVTDLSVYIAEGDYCFAYPPRFFLNHEGGVRSPDLDDSLTPLYMTFAVTVTPANLEFTARGEAELFLQDFTVVDVDTLAWTPVMVGDEWGWMVEPVPTMGAWRFVFVQHNGYLYRLSYWPVDIPEARADVDELAQVTLGSFAFIR
jgi:hypothetical protein